MHYSNFHVPETAKFGIFLMGLFFGGVFGVLFFGATVFSAPEVGEFAYKDNFEILDTDSVVGFDPSFQNPRANVLGESENNSVRFEFYNKNYPLFASDYYYAKHINAAAGVNEINEIPVLRAGDEVSLIGDGYITLFTSEGYIAPPNGFYYASGVCWTVSVLGGIMDDANAKFKDMYGIDLFIYDPGTRYPHSGQYPTYGDINNGYGYAIYKSSAGNQDFIIKVNPEIKEYPAIANLEIKMELYSSVEDPEAYNGESIGGAIYTNMDLNSVDLVRDHSRKIYEGIIGRIWNFSS